MEFVTFEWQDNGKFLSLVRKEMHGYWHLVFQDDANVIPTLWEVMPTGEEHLSSPVVRVRGRQDNSLWRKSPGSDYVLSEGPSEEEKAALFAFIKVDYNTFSLLCLGNNRYVKSSKGDTYAPNALIASEKTNASELCKFRVNKELPKYASFHWNDLALGRKEMHGYCHLPFENTNEVTAWEVVPTYEKHGSAHIVRLRLPQNDASIWRKSTGSDWVLSAGAAQEDPNSHFVWVKVKVEVADNTVSLFCLGNNRYLKVENGSTYAPNALSATEETNASNLCKLQVKDALP